jgi:hypothetical protein
MPSRDLVFDVQWLLNDNKYMNVHAILSALANEIVGLRAEVERLEDELKECKREKV